MKTTKASPGALLLTLSVMLITGCEITNNTNDTDTIRGSGIIATEVRTLADCTGLSILNIGVVHISQGEHQSVLVEADDNIIDRVITRKEDDQLVVGIRDGSYTDITLNIYVTLPSIYFLTIDGAGTITAGNDIETDTLICVVNGAGNCNVRGNGDYFYASVNGAGNISARDFTAKSCTASLNGTGNISVYVTEELEATVVGVGTITYYGNPPVVRATVTGVGRIIRG